MLALIPTHTPPLSALLADLGNPSADRVGAALDVSARTVRRWQADDLAPRVALLSLFWVSRWGFSVIDCAAHNAAAMHAGMVACLKAENDALRAEIGRVLALNGHGAANAPSWRYSAPQAPIAALVPARRSTGA